MWSRWTGLALVLRTAAAEAFVASPAPECAWCEAGNDACNHSYAAYELDLVETSISGAIYEAGDAGLDEATMLWWGASADDGVEPDRGERDWHWGGNSTAELGASLSSFSVLDEIIEALEAAHPPSKGRRRGPLRGRAGRDALRALLAARDAARGRVLRGEPILRDLPERVAPGAAAARCCDATIASTSYAFAAPGGRCADYDAYGYGLAGPLHDHVAATGKARAIDAYGRRTVVYVSGAADVCDARYAARARCAACVVDDGGLDTSCEAYAQGWCRMERLHAFAQFRRGIFQSREFARARL
ncbi:hypothetical protein JL722_521 [Aureococcus anophagefferens]|nr:hypothetical protein JL722_521 [Aureococcus anophagefferens]